MRAEVPVVHLTCLCYDRQEIDEFARQLQAEGIENILALRGDRNPDIPEKEDFKHASDLITYMKEKGDFCVAGACYPEDHPESESHMQELKALMQGQNYCFPSSFLTTACFMILLPIVKITGLPCR